MRIWNTSNNMKSFAVLVLMGEIELVLRKSQHRKVTKNFIETKNIVSSVLLINDTTIIRQINFKIF